MQNNVRTTQSGLQYFILDINMAIYHFLIKKEFQQNIGKIIMQRI